MRKNKEEVVKTTLKKFGNGITETDIYLIDEDYYYGNPKTWAEYEEGLERLSAASKRLLEETSWQKFTKALYFEVRAELDRVSRDCPGHESPVCCGFFKYSEEDIQRFKELHVFLPCSGPKWRPYHDFEWYLQELQGLLAELYWSVGPDLNTVEMKRSIFEAHLASAFQIGVLWKELNLKREWEQSALFGRKQRDASSQGGKNSTKGAITDRVQLVQRLLDNGHTQARAYDLASKKLGVSPRQIRRNWEAFEKSRATSGDGH